MLFCVLPSVCSVQTCRELSIFMFLAQILELLTSLRWTKEPTAKITDLTNDNILQFCDFQLFRKLSSPSPNPSSQQSPSHDWSGPSLKNQLQ